MDISCNDREPYRQDFNPDNELAIVVNPKVPTHLLAGSNDYFYRFNNSTGVRAGARPDRLLHLLRRRRQLGRRAGPA